METIEQAFVDRGANALAHFGIKGMKWGVRRNSSSSSTAVGVQQKGKKLQTKGGANHPASSDAKNAAKGAQIAKKSGTHALTNEELRHVVNRMNLEQQYSKLVATQGGPKVPGAKFAADVLGNVAKTQATRLANDAVTKQLGSILKTATNAKG